MSAVAAGAATVKTTGRIGNWFSKNKKSIAGWTAGGVGAGLLISPIGDDIAGNVGNSVGGLFGGLANGFGAAGILPFSSCAGSSCVIVIIILMLTLGS